MDTQIPAGETTVIYVDETGGTPLYEKNILTADGNGGLSGGVKMYFPESGKNADIYALHTNASWSGNAYPASALTHTVAVDQRARGDYAASDLLYGRTMNVAKTTQDVGLTFYHLLSKVQVAVVAGKGLTPADIRGITIGGTRIEALFALDKATAPGTVAVTAAGTARDIMAGADVSQEFTAPLYNDVVIVPQTVAGNTAFITVHLVTGDLVYRLPVNVTFTGGRRYIYQITANLAGLELKTSIANWTPINPVAGDAVIE
ncbi:MAG: fimbrillin family protein [Odoribacteraceae bacterium]|nr:fimbrillin family protein [Odoribacteraceae bacterium]